MFLFFKQNLWLFFHFLKVSHFVELNLIFVFGEIHDFCSTFHRLDLLHDNLSINDKMSTHKLRITRSSFLQFHVEQNNV